MKKDKPEQSLLNEIIATTFVVDRSYKAPIGTFTMHRKPEEMKILQGLTSAHIDDHQKINGWCFIKNIIDEMYTPRAQKEFDEILLKSKKFMESSSLYRKKFNDFE